jgi:hypothetical protein
MGHVVLSQSCPVLWKGVLEGGAACQQHCVLKEFRSEILFADGVLPASYRCAQLLHCTRVAKAWHHVVLTKQHTSVGMRKK